MAEKDMSSMTLGKYVAVELTGDCPCHCSFCYKITEEGRSFQFNDDSSIRAFLTTLRDGGVKSINWTGGEPTWCSKLSDILRIAKQEFDFTNILSTCCLLKDYDKRSPQEILKFWQSIQFDLDYVSISHDELHSHKQPEAAQQFLAWYREGRFSFRLKVNTLVARQENKNTITCIAKDILPTVCVWNLIEYVPREHSGESYSIKWLSKDEMKQAFADAIDTYYDKCMATPAFKFHNDDSPYHILLITPNTPGAPSLMEYWLPVKDKYMKLDPADSGREEANKLYKEQVSGNSLDVSENNTIYSRYEHSGFETEYCRFILGNITRSIKQLLLEGCAPENNQGIQNQITSPFLRIPKSRIKDSAERYAYLCKELFVENEPFAAWIRKVTGIYYAGLFFRQYSSGDKYTRISVTQATDDRFVSPVFFPSHTQRNIWLKSAAKCENNNAFTLFRELDERCDTVAKGPREGKVASFNPAPIAFDDAVMANWQFARLEENDTSHVSFRKIGTLDNLELWTFFCTESDPESDRKGSFGAFISFMEGLASFLLQFVYGKFSAANEASRLEQERAETLLDVDARVIQLIDDIETLKSQAVTLRQTVRPDGPVFCERAQELIRLFDHGKQVGLVIRKVADNTCITEDDLNQEIKLHPQSSDYFVEISRITSSKPVPFAVKLVSSHSAGSIDTKHFRSFQNLIKAFGVFVDIPLLTALGALQLEDNKDKQKLYALVKLLCQRHIAPSETKEKYKVIYDAQLVCYLLNEFKTITYGNNVISIDDISSSWIHILMPDRPEKEFITSPISAINAPVVAKLPRSKRPIDVLAPLCALAKELSRDNQNCTEARITSIQINSESLTTKVNLYLSKAIAASTLHGKAESLEGKHGLSSPLHRLCDAFGQEYIHETATPTDEPGVRIVNSNQEHLIELVFAKDNEWLPSAPTETDPV